MHDRMLALRPRFKGARTCHNSITPCSAAAVGKEPSSGRFKFGRLRVEPESKNTEKGSSSSLGVPAASHSLLPLSPHSRMSLPTDRSSLTASSSTGSGKAAARANFTPNRSAQVRSQAHTLPLLRCKTALLTAFSSMNVFECLYLLRLSLCAHHARSHPGSYERCGKEGEREVLSSGSNPSVDPDSLPPLPQHCKPSLQPLANAPTNALLHTSAGRCSSLARLRSAVRLRA